MGCPPVRKIIHSLKLVDYLHVQADNPWYNYYLFLFVFQYRAWARPEAVDQTPYSLEVGIEILEFFEEYFNITYPLPKQGIVELKKKNG